MLFYDYKENTLIFNELNKNTKINFMLQTNDNKLTVKANIPDNYYAYLKSDTANKILFFAELYHRYFFKEPMITDISFKILPYGHALNKEDIDWENAETNYNFLRKDEKNKQE